MNESENAVLHQRFSDAFFLLADAYALGVLVQESLTRRSVAGGAGTCTAAPRGERQAMPALARTVRWVSAVAAAVLAFVRFAVLPFVLSSNDSTVQVTSLFSSRHPLSSIS